MKKIFLLTIFAALAFTACQSKKDVFPAGKWHQDCAQFSSVAGGFKLEDKCCQYLDIPKLEIGKNKSFRTTGIYHAFTGAGYSSQNAPVSGTLSADGQKLNISYTVNGLATEYSMEAGPIVKVCNCGCD